MTTKTGIEVVENTDTFQKWIDTTNEVVDIVNENVMLAAPGVGFTTVGNSTLEGTFTANTIEASSANVETFLVDEITNRTDPDSNIIVNSPVRILSPSNLENMLEIQTNTGERPIVGLINGANGRWNLALKTSTASSSFTISTPGASPDQFELSQNGVLTATRFVGNGSTITNLSANNVASGTLPSDRLPSLIEKFVTFRDSGGTRFDRSANNDGVLVRGRDGGTSGYSVTITPTTLTGNRNLTLANGDTVLVAGTMVPTSRTVTGSVGISSGGSLSSNVSLELAGQARAFHNLATNGFAVKTGDSLAASRTITSGTLEQISIANGDGVSGNPTISAIIASQVEAEAGSSSKLMTSVRVAQSITARIASQIEAEEGVNASKLMTPLRTKQAINQYKFTSSEQTPSLNGRYVFPHTLGVVPSNVVIILRCEIPDKEYVKNDVVYIYPGHLDPNSGNAMSANADSSNIRVGNYYIYVQTKTTGTGVSTWQQITYGNWRISVRAWA